MGRHLPRLHGGGHNALEGPRHGAGLNSRLSPPGWDAPELGLPRATALAILIVAGMAMLAIRLTTLPRPQPAPQVIQVMHVTLTELPRQAPPAPPAPPRTVPPPTSGIGPYGDQIYSIIQANQAVPDVVAQLGLSGTAIVEITVAPSGHILSAKITKSSGVPLIDQTALQHAQAASLPPFNSQMPQAPHNFLVPIDISPNGSE